MENDSNDIFIMIISATVVLLILVIFIVSFLFLYKNRQVSHLTEMEKVKEQFNQEILKAELEIKEQTMKNISEEIHDNVGQVLSLVVLNLSSIDVGEREKAEAKIERTTMLVQKAVADLRNLSKTMDADNIATLGLAAIVKFELDLLEKTGLYRTSLQIVGEAKKLDGQKELILYRIIQESLNNIIKHAKATAIDVVLRFSETENMIEIADNGMGFDTKDLTVKNDRPGGAGLKNMNKRAKLIGGSFTLSSVPSTGTTILINLPA